MLYNIFRKEAIMKAKAKITRQKLIQLLLSQKDTKEEIEELVDLLVEKQVSINVTKELNKKITFGQKASDKLAEVAGSWYFIGGFGLFMLFWIIFNIYWLSQPVDPYPFILLNLVLSCLAAIQAPIIMMSQNRQEQKDRLRNEHNYKVDLKSELLLEDLHKKMDRILYSQRTIKDKLNVIEDYVDGDEESVTIE
jgi:uncharacterized membrane protein